MSKWVDKQPTSAGDTKDRIMGPRGLNGPQQQWETRRCIMNIQNTGYPFTF